jgi:hypothetical protein
VRQTLSQQGGTVTSLKHLQKQSKDEYRATIKWRDQDLKVVVDSSGRIVSKGPAKGHAA